MTSPSGGSTTVIPVTVASSIVSTLLGVAESGWTIINQGPTRIWASTIQSVSSQNGTPIEAFTSLTWNSSGFVYACLDSSSTQASTVVLTPDITGYQPSPVDIAAQIATAGIFTTIKNVVNIGTTAAGQHTWTGLNGYATLLAEYDISFAAPSAQSGDILTFSLYSGGVGGTFLDQISVGVQSGISSENGTATSFTPGTSYRTAIPLRGADTVVLAAALLTTSINFPSAQGAPIATSAQMPFAHAQFKAGNVGTYYEQRTFTLAGGAGAKSIAIPCDSRPWELTLSLFRAGSVGTSRFLVVGPYNGGGQDWLQSTVTVATTYGPQQFLSSLEPMYLQIADPGGANNSIVGIRMARAA